MACRVEEWCDSLAAYLDFVVDGGDPVVIRAIEEWLGVEHVAFCENQTDCAFICGGDASRTGSGS